MTLPALSDDAAAPERVRRLLIEERRAGHPAHEEALLASHADAIGIPVERMTWKPFTRRGFRLVSGDVVAGSVNFIRTALQSLGKTLPPPNPYPDQLTYWLHRRVWRCDSLGRALDAFPDAFLKPAKRWKLFTGFIPGGPNPAELHGVSRREPVWCSTPVKFVSEWRAYIIGEIPHFVGLCPFSNRIFPELCAVDRAARLFAPFAPKAYAMDFGVLDTGETALVEVNDGFAVGAYDGIPAAIYFEFVATRWLELAA